MRETSPRLLVDLGAAALRHIAGALCGLCVIPIIARSLGAEALGAWTLLGTTSFVMGVADLGLGTCVQRAVARGDDAGVRREIGLAITVVSVTAPLLGLAFFAMFDDTLATSGCAFARPAMATALTAGLINAFAFPYRAFLLVRGGMGALAGGRAFASLLQVGLTLALLPVTHTLLAPAGALLFAALLEAAWTVKSAVAKEPALPLRPRWPGAWSPVAAALREGAATLVINIAFLAALRLDVLLLAKFVPLTAVAAYGIAARAIDQAYVLAKQVSAATLSRLVRAEDRPAAVRQGTRLMGVMVAAGMPALAIDGRRLLAAWGGPVASSSVAEIAAMLLGMAAIIAAAEEVAAAALTVGGPTAWITARAMLAGTAVNLLLSVAGARTIGAGAVAFATVVGNLVTAALIWKGAAGLLGWSRAQVLETLAPLPTAALVATLLAHLLAPLAAGSIGASLLAAALAFSAGLLAGGAAAWATSLRAERGGQPLMAAAPASQARQATGARWLWTPRAQRRSS